MSNYVIIVAGGTGTRMNSDTPKQFMLLAGKPILMHTLEKFVAADGTLQLIVVLPENEIGEWKKLCAAHHFEIPHQVTKGGETRFHSVRNGLSLIKEICLVAIHDGVRPLTSESLIRKCFVETKQNGSSVPCVSLPESIRRVEPGRNEIADRNAYVSVQTPQCFPSNVLQAAYAAEYRAAFTDDASVVEASGRAIHLVEGEQENIKITYPADLVMAEALIKRRN